MTGNEWALVTRMMRAHWDGGFIVGCAAGLFIGVIVMWSFA